MKNFPFVAYDNGIIIGFVADIWKALEEHLKFKTVVRLSKLSSQLEILNQTNSDVTLNPIDLNSMDLDHYDHTMPITTIWHHLYAKVEPDSGNSNFYFLIWGREVRTSYYATVIILALVFDRALLTWKRGGSRFKVSSSLCSLMHVFAIVNNQGSQFNVTKSSLRVIVLSAAFFGFFMSVSYSAMLTSKLTAKGRINPEITLEKVLKNQIPLCVSTTSYSYQKFTKRSENGKENELMRDWSSLLNKAPCSSTRKEGNVVSWLPPEDFCHDDAVALEMSNVYNNYYSFNNFYKKQPNCKTFRSAKRYYYTYLALMTRKGFPLRHFISRRLHSHGIIEKIKTKWMPKQEQKRETEFQVTFRHIRTVLNLYILAVAVALAVLMFELYLYRYKERDLVVTEKQKVPRNWRRVAFI